MKFLIVASGYNCRRLAIKCIMSVHRQRYTNFKAVFISDGSTDRTLLDINGVDDMRLTSCVFQENKGAAFRRWEAIKNFCDDPETVIVLLGLDDELLPNALEIIKQQYDNGKWMTYGNWISQNGKGLPDNFPLDFDNLTHENRDYRKVKYRSTAPNTFKRFLFDELSEEDFKIDGRWIDSTTESPVMFACLEMCGKEKIGIIRDKIYFYNQNLPNGTIKRQGYSYKYKIYNQIIQREKKPLLIR